MLLTRLQQRPLLARLILACVACASLWWGISSLQSQPIASTATGHARDYSETLKESRSLYASEVVSTTKKEELGLSPGHSQREREPLRSRKSRNRPVAAMPREDFESDQGEPRAKNKLGLKYTYGRGVAQDHERAMTLFREAAEAGETHALNNIGWMYRDGRGVSKDYKEAAKWFRKSAEAGNSWAMLNLGLLYKDGRGVSQDDEEAVRWFRKAAPYDAEAANHLGLMYTNGRGVPWHIVHMPIR